MLMFLVLFYVGQRALDRTCLFYASFKHLFFITYNTMSRVIQFKSKYHMYVHVVIIEIRFNVIGIPFVSILVKPIAMYFFLPFKINQN
jgi:hypothetical protein